MTCHATLSGHALPRLSVVIKRKHVDLAAYRRSVLNVSEIREVNPWVPLGIFLMGIGFFLRITYQMAFLQDINLTVVGLA